MARHWNSIGLLAAAIAAPSVSHAQLFFPSSYSQQSPTGATFEGLGLICDMRQTSLGSRAIKLSGDGRTVVVGIRDGQDQTGVLHQDYLWNEASGLGWAPIDGIIDVSYDASVMISKRLAWRLGQGAWLPRVRPGNSGCCLGAGYDLSAVSGDGSTILANVTWCTIAYGAARINASTGAYSWLDPEKCLPPSIDYWEHIALGTSYDAQAIALRCWQNPRREITVIRGDGCFSVPVVNQYSAILAGSGDYFVQSRPPAIRSPTNPGEPCRIVAEGTPHGISYNGDVIVGTGGVQTSPPHAPLWIWTAQLGRIDLIDLMQRHGLDLTGWQLQSVTGLSYDGTVVAGNGINPEGWPEAWRARLPLPWPELPSNLPCFGGTMDFGAISRVLSNWGIGVCVLPNSEILPFDPNGDGVFDYSDLTTVLTYWGLTCAQ